MLLNPPCTGRQSRQENRGRTVRFHGPTNIAECVGPGRAIDRYRYHTRIFVRASFRTDVERPSRSRLALEHLRPHTTHADTSVRGHSSSAFTPSPLKRANRLTDGEVSQRILGRTSPPLCPCGRCVSRHRRHCAVNQPCSASPTELFVPMQHRRSLHERSQVAGHQRIGPSRCTARWCPIAGPAGESCPVPDD